MIELDDSIIQWAINVLNNADQGDWDIPMSNEELDQFMLMGPGR